MKHFDKAIASFTGFPGYFGDIPKTEAEYTAKFTEEFNRVWEDKPTWAEVQTVADNIQKELVKNEAIKKIAKTDWAVLPDVGISNVAEFEEYRATLREIIKNPVLNPEYPAEPDPVWI